MTGDSIPSHAFDPAATLSALRSTVGAASWISPRYAWRGLGLGPGTDPSAALVTRLFGVRDLALGLALKHPNPEVRRAALKAGVAADSIDVVASLIALRRGAPKVTLLTAAGGAALFAALGLAALARVDDPVAAEPAAAGGLDATGN